MSSGTLYLVSTPIGNLEDITLRALRILREVPRIACEDTRQTRKLLDHHGLDTPTTSFHRFNERRALPGLIAHLRSGRDLALVTDGGTPSLSDPGFLLVRAAIEAGVPVSPIPGPSALSAALVASGLPAERFLFLGFLPHRSGERRRLLERYRDREETLVLFDSPRRVSDSLRDLVEILGDRPAAVCREMTKIHEEFRRGSLSALAEEFRVSTVRGEVTLVVGGAGERAPAPAPEDSLRREVEEEIRVRGLSRTEAIRAVARRRNLPRREVYRSVSRDVSGPGDEESGSS